MRYVIGTIIVLAQAATFVSADNKDGNGIDDDLYLAPHPAKQWWLSGQLNVIAQAQPGFHSPYRGDNSFRPDDHTVELGFDVTTGPWGRSRDQFGLAAVTNGISTGHRTYLALGGKAFCWVMASSITAARILLRGII